MEAVFSVRWDITWRISKASVELAEYFPKRNMDSEYASFLEIQKQYNNTL